MQASLEEALEYEPSIVHVVENNRIVALGNDIAEAVPGSDTVSARI